MAKKDFDLGDKYSEEVAEFKQVGFAGWVTANKGLAAGLAAVAVVVLLLVVSVL